MPCWDHKTPDIVRCRAFLFWDGGPSAILSDFALGTLVFWGTKCGFPIKVPAVPAFNLDRKDMQRIRRPKYAYSEKVLTFAGSYAYRKLIHETVNILIGDIGMCCGGFAGAGEGSLFLQ